MNAVFRTSKARKTKKIITYLFDMMYSLFKNLESIYYFCEIDYIFKTEQWKDVLGYEGLYKISDLGRIKSISRQQKHPRGHLYVLKDKILSVAPDQSGYLQGCLYKDGKFKTYKNHKLVAIAFLNHIPNGKYDFVIDHKDNNKFNNCLINLRIVTLRENVSKDRKNKTSKYTGVCWNKRNKKWFSQIQHKKEHFYLGMFDTEIEAHNAYQNKLKTFT